MQAPYMQAQKKLKHIDFSAFIWHEVGNIKDSPPLENSGNAEHENDSHLKYVNNYFFISISSFYLQK